MYFISLMITFSSFSLLLNGGLASQDAADEQCAKQNVKLQGDVANTTFFSEFTFENETRDAMQLTWSDDNSGIILLVTTQDTPSIFGELASPSEIYRSADNGVTFTRITKELDNGKTVFIRRMLGLQKHTNHTKKIYLLSYNPMGSGTVLFSTKDAGKTWQKSVLPFNVANRLVFHPRSEHHDRILAHDQGTKVLYYSEDSGATWRPIQNNVEAFAWGDNPQDAPGIIYSAVSKSVMPSNTDNWFQFMMKQQLLQSTMPERKLMKTSDFGATWQVLQERIFAFSTKSKYLYVTAVYNNDNKRRGMLVSVDGGKSFDSVQLPDISHDRFFSILDIEDDMVFMHVDDPEDNGHGKLYISDASGVVFSLSLEEHFFPNYMGVTDFFRLSSMRGTYITSQMNRDGSMHSLITFNRGAEWIPLKKPGNVPCINNDENCNLQVSGAYSKQMGVVGGLPLSVSNAVGIVMVHGHAADKLKVLPPDVYVSSNGGYTWRKALDGPHHYQIANHGGLLVAVSANTSTPNEVKFSTDEGNCWHTYKFTTKKILFAGLLTEPGNRAMTVAVYGYDIQSKKWSVHVIDFAKLISRQCSTEDYETWYAHSDMLHPLGQQFQGCLLGRKESFLRLKKDALCAHGYSHEHKKNEEFCACTKDDYECEYGFSRTVNSRLCVRNPLIKELDVCIQGNAQRIRSSGYRKIPGDVCMGGFAPDLEQQTALKKKCNTSINLMESVNENKPVDSNLMSNLVAFQHQQHVKSTEPGRKISLLWVILPLVALVGFIMGAVLFVRNHKRNKRQAVYKYSLLNGTGGQSGPSAGGALGAISGGNYGGVSNDAEPILGAPVTTTNTTTGPVTAPSGFIIASRPGSRYLASSHMIGASAGQPLPTLMEENTPPRRKGYHDDSDVDLLE